MVVLMKIKKKRPLEYLATDEVKAPEVKEPEVKAPEDKAPEVKKPESTSASVFGLFNNKDSAVPNVVTQKKKKRNKSKCICSKKKKKEYCKKYGKSRGRGRKGKMPKRYSSVSTENAFNFPKNEPHPSEISPYENQMKQ